MHTSGHTPAKAALTILLTAGVLATSTAIVAGDPAPPAHADGLVRFESCAGLRDWYVDHTVKDVSAWGWGGGRMEPMTLRGSDSELAPSSADASTGVANGPTGTNVQEAGVDEPDVAKTDGHVVVQLTGGRRVVVTDVTGAEPHQLSTWTLPGSTYADGLLLVDHHVLLAGRSSVAIGREGFAPMPSALTTTLYDLDVSDPAHPVLDHTRDLPGRELSMRQYGDTVRVVSTLGLPPLRFVQPRAGLTGSNDAEQRNRAIVRASSIRDWLPGLDCRDVYRPRLWSGPDTVVVSTLTPGGVGDVAKVAVAGGGEQVYSSTDRLYVTSTQQRPGPVPLDGGPVSSDVARPDLAGTFPVHTQVHAFALDGATTRYVASGVVDGAVRDEWSMDEHDGYLRVAVTRTGSSGTAVDVLAERDGRLEQVGELAGLAPGETLQSVRWFDDLAVVVTFRQTDPLFTVDLADPQHPRLFGELRIPGFSSYLHPIGDQRLLGLGTDADTAGRVSGAQAAVFDLADPAHATELGRAAFADSGFVAASDPHAFTWLPGTSSAIATLQGPGDAVTPVLLHVATDGSLSRRRLPSPGGWEQRALPLEDGRVALVGDTVRLVEVG